MERKVSSLIFAICVVVLTLCMSTGRGYGMDNCRASFIDPVTDIRWDAMFPVEIAGIEVKGPGNLPDPDKIGSVICMCRRGNNIVLGVTVSYWNPTRIVETTKVPYCFPTMGGMQISNPEQGTKYGSNETDTPYTKQNAHWYVFPVWQVLDLFVDNPCVPVEGFDLAYITEIDPTWNNDLTGFLLNPEALLFGNPVAQLACVADSVAATVNKPLDPLFWCQGSWGSAYPLTGSISEGNYIKANAALAARMIYKMNREALHWDTAVDYCGAQITPIWFKSHYKIHMLKPVRSEPMFIGRPSPLWETGKNPPFGTKSNSPDNFSWVIFQRVKCCFGKMF
ncbi:MAG: TraU family protein [Candidatus Bathyarchaeia archaeon]